MLLLYLEEVREVSQVENVVELHCRRQEGGRDALVEAQRCLDDVLADLLDRGRELEPRLVQVLVQDLHVDGEERVL